MTKNVHGAADAHTQTRARFFQLCLLIRIGGSPHPTYLKSMYVKSRMFVVDAPSIDGPRHRTYIPEHLQASGILYHIIRPSLHRASASGPRASRRAFDSVEGGGIGGGCLDLSRRNRHFSRAQITSLTSQLPPIRHDATSAPRRPLA